MVFSCQWIPEEPPTQHWPPILHSQNAVSLSLWHTPVVPINLHYRAKESFTVTFLCCNTCGSWMEGRGSTLATCRAPAPPYLLQSYNCNCYFSPNLNFKCNCNSSCNWETVICKPANAENVQTVVWRICFDLELDDISLDHTEFCSKSLEEGQRNKQWYWKSTWMLGSPSAFTSHSVESLPGRQFSAIIEFFGLSHIFESISDGCYFFEPDTVIRPNLCPDQGQEKQYQPRRASPLFHPHLVL